MHIDSTWEDVFAARAKPLMCWPIAACLRCPDPPQRSSPLAVHPYQSSLVSVLKDNHRDAGHHQEDGQPHLTGEGGPAENEH
jgi:hypothetical protein